MGQIGHPMHGLTETGWPGCNRSGGDGGVVCALQAGLERLLSLVSQNKRQVLLSLVRFLLFAVLLP